MFGEPSRLKPQCTHEEHNSDGTRRRQEDTVRACVDQLVRVISPVYKNARV